MNFSSLRFDLLYILKVQCLTLNIVFNGIWLMTFMNKCTKYCHPNLVLGHPNSIYRNKVWYILHLNIFVEKYHHR